MKISVITVCYNEEKNIASTIESVLSQTSSDYEYLICDGKSSDRTVEIAQSYKNKFENKNVDYKVFSEKDKGIYFGMNNGIQHATGDYLIFINSGDKLHDGNVLSDIIQKVGDQKPAVIYGNCLYIDRGLGAILRGDHTQLKNCMSISHPATLVRSDFIKSIQFDTTYKIAADYNMMLSLYMQNQEFLYIDVLVSKFYLDGISSVRIVDSIKEAARVRESHNIQVDLKSELENVNKFERINRIKKSVPLFLWKIWNKNIKKRMWIED